MAARGGRTSAREIDPDRRRLRRSVVGGDRSRRGGCRPPDERGMNVAREDANARDMFRARRKKTRVERGLGSDGPRDGGIRANGSWRPVLCGKRARIVCETSAGPKVLLEATPTGQDEFPKTSTSKKL